MKSSFILALTLLGVSPAMAQQDVPFANGIPVAPELQVPPVPHEPRVYETAEGMDVVRACEAVGSGSGTTSAAVVIESSGEVEA